MTGIPVVPARPTKAFVDMNESELREYFDAIAKLIASILPENTGFILLATPFGPNSAAQYVSNVHPPDAASWMLETIDRWMTKDFVPRE